MYRRGDAQVVRFGRTVRIERVEVDRLIAEHRASHQPLPLGTIRPLTDRDIFAPPSPPATANLPPDFCWPPDDDDDQPIAFCLAEWATGTPPGPGHEGYGNGHGRPA